MQAKYSQFANSEYHQDPALPSRGMMIQEGPRFIFDAPRIIIPPLAE
ncbi:MAG: hypothetical protein KBA61_19350 [Spirochaetes bacterium]|nr:hypothetical protein [Spirochaetota bacterium]